ncbi:unnamed protein product [Strongylus vulgaris]|uniref:Uncharacterized protein n=1 Tax=Strongylus vulgaris TaxID=40348 RepID=A0A3P7JPQ6_STRVU|nr:unnamed protein product [Strongylus vulgaris]
MEALIEAIREQISSILASLDPNDDVKVLVHNAILDQCGLMQKVGFSRLLQKLLSLSIGSRKLFIFKKCLLYYSSLLIWMLSVLS